MSNRFLNLALFGWALLPVACAYQEVVDDEPVDVGSTDQDLYVQSPKLWPQGTIQTCWENPTADNAQGRAWTAEAVARSWESASNVRFVGWGACTTNSMGVRIRVIDEANAPHTVGLGTDLYGRVDGVSLNFTFTKWSIFCSLASERENCIRASGVHEFGHVLGFAHEQNRPDTTPCSQGAQGTNGDTLFGAWDLSSVMDYCNPTWNNGGVLSATDRAGAAALYGTRKIADFGYTSGSWKSDKHVRAIADVNDDGRDDIVGFGDDGVQVSISNGAGFNAPQQFIADFGYNQGWRNDRHVRVLSDVNADGRADIVAFGNDGVFLSLSGSNQFYPWSLLGDFGYNQGWRVERHVRTLADVNGDGRPDVVGFGNAGVYVALAVGGSFGASQYWLAEFGYDQGWRNEKNVRTLADVNDDGRADIVGFGAYGVYVSLSTGSGFAPSKLFTSDFGYNTGWRVDKHPRFVVDVNLDGRADIVGFGDDGAWVALSGSNTFYPQQLAVADLGYNQGWRVDANPRFIADANGDARPDIIGYGTAGVYVAVGLGGPSFRPMELWALRYTAVDGGSVNNAPLAAREYQRGVGDFDGDGGADLVGFGVNGVHTTDLTVHIIPPPAGVPRSRATDTLPGKEVVVVDPKVVVVDKKDVVVSKKDVVISKAELAASK